MSDVRVYKSDPNDKRKSKNIPAVMDYFKECGKLYNSDTLPNELKSLNDEEKLQILDEYK